MVPPRILFLASALALAAGRLHGGEFQAAAGLFFLVPEGADVTVAYRPDRSPWSFGLRYVQWRDTSHDIFTGRSLSHTRETRTGPLVSYRFRPQAPGGAYLAVSLYRWTKRETSLVGGDSGTAATTSPAFGGGYSHAMGRHGFWNVGMLLSPGTRLDTHTSTGSEQDSGTFDVLALMGVRF